MYVTWTARELVTLSKTPSKHLPSGLQRTASRLR